MYLTPVLLTALFVAPPPQVDNRPAEDALREACDDLSKPDTKPRPNTEYGAHLARVELWCLAGKLRHRLGDRDGALAALREAGKVSDVRDQRRIAKAFGEIDEAKAVLDLAAKVPENTRHLALQDAAQAAVEAGHVKTAELLAGAIADEKTRAAAREFIRRTVATASAAEGTAVALRAVERLPTAAEKVSALVGLPMLVLHYDDSDTWPGGVVLARLRAGDTAGAKEAALKALALLPDVDAKDRSKAAVGVVRMLFRLDDVPAARKALAQIQAGDPSAGAAEVRLRARLELIAMGYLATAVVRAGRDADAKALLKETARPGDQAYLWHVIALAQARAGRKDEAKVSFAAAFELVGAEANPVGGGTTPHNVICAQALSGDIDGAIRNAARLRAEAPTWGTITSVQIRMKDFAGARETAVFIGTDNMFYYPRTLRLIASAQARAGQAAAVREWAEKLEDKLIRAHALVGLAEGLYREPMKPGP